MKKNNGRIKDIVIATTYKCNARCRFCDIWKNQSPASLSPDIYQRLPRSLERINISGGEPFLKDDIVDDIKAIRNHLPKSKIIISTNGFSLSLIKKKMVEIMRIKPDIGIAVSIDGIGKFHDEIRGFPGGYGLAIETIRSLKEDLGIKNLKIAFTLSDKNINQLKRVYRLSREMGVEFSLAVVHNSPHFFHKHDNQVKNIRKTQEELRWLIAQEIKGFSPKRWLRAYFAFGASVFLESGKRVLPDYSGVDAVFIDPAGNVYPSDVWSMRLGNIKKIREWQKISDRFNKKIVTHKNPRNWMICTARSAIKRHWKEVLLWVVKEKTIFHLKNLFGSDLKIRLRKLSSHL